MENNSYRSKTIGIVAMENNSYGSKTIGIVAMENNSYRSKTIGIVAMENNSYGSKTIGIVAMENNRYRSKTIGIVAMELWQNVLNTSTLSFILLYYLFIFIWFFYCFSFPCISCFFICYVNVNYWEERKVELWRRALQDRGLKASRSKTEYLSFNDESVGDVMLQGNIVCYKLAICGPHYQAKLKIPTHSQNSNEK